MNNNATLPNFPTTIFATAQRRKQAAIREARELALRSNPGGLASVFSKVLPPDFLSGLEEAKRKRHFPNREVLWAWLYQIFNSNASCVDGVCYIQSMCVHLGLPVPASDTSSYCQARKRLPLQLVDRVLEKTIEVIERDTPGYSNWKGMRLMALDGSKIDLSDTPENQIEYPQHSSIKEGCGFPMMGIAALFNLSNGSLQAFESGRQQGHDIKHAPDLLGHCAEGDLLMGDRGFCSYELMALAQQRGVQTLVRLHQARHKALRKRGWRGTTNDMVEIWKKPSQPLKSTLSKEQWKELPDQIEVRYAKAKGRDRYGKEDTIVVATSLLDRKEYGSRELVNLYLKRWEIEVHFRCIKTTLDLQKLEVKTPEMARKGLKVAAIAYNLLRWLMLKNSSLGELSFSATLKVLKARATNFEHKIRAEKIARKLLEICASWTLRKRPGRSEPRVVKRRHNSYPILTTMRSEYQEPVRNGRKPRIA